MLRFRFSLLAGDRALANDVTVSVSYVTGVDVTLSQEGLTPARTSELCSHDVSAESVTPDR